MRKLLLTAVMAIVAVGLVIPIQAQEKSKAEKQKEDTQKQVTALFKKHCATSGCHRGQTPKKKLNLEADKFVAAVVDVPSLQVDSLKLVDTKNPEKSYLLMKVKGTKGIVGDRMPEEAPPLKPEQIAAIEQWISSLQASVPSEGTKKVPEAEKKSPKMNDEASGGAFETPAFWGMQLINLPTTQSISKREVLFRVSHRFFPAVSEGYDEYFGLNGPANILIGLGVGITEDLSFGFGHSNFNHEWELALQWRLLEQGRQWNFPLSVSLRASGSLITQKTDDESVFRSENFKSNWQLMLSRQFTNALSVLLVPSLATNTYYLDPLTENTFALGTGARFMFMENISLVGEWVPVLSGYKFRHNAWGLGLEYKVGGHVFHVFATNSFGLTSDQYLTGGNLDFKENDYRIGFNIYRSFWF
jgi:mono/diheme cytochrome c family protein